MLKLYMDGAVVLVGAILVNIGAKFMDVTTWFQFANDIAFKGFGEAVSGQSPLSLLFLFVVYPLILGFLVRMSYKY